MNALMPWIRRTPPGSNAGGVRPRGAVVRAGRGANIVRDQVSRLRLKIFWGAQCAFVPRIKNSILASSVPERKSQSVGTATDLQVKLRSANWWRVGSKRFASRTSIGILSNHSPEECPRSRRALQSRSAFSGQPRQPGGRLYALQRAVGCGLLGRWLLPGQDVHAPTRFRFAVADAQWLDQSPTRLKPSPKTHK